MYMKILNTFVAASLFSISALSIPPAYADGGDFSLDFTASEPTTYDHLVGGGAYNDRTVGADIVESLEGGDFACGDTVSFLTQVVNDNTDPGSNQTIQLDYAFTADSTGRSGVALSEVTLVQVNYIPQPLSLGPDTGNQDDGESVATLISSALTGPLFTSGAELLATVELTDLEASEEVIVRVDVLITCDPGARPTGNLQARLDAARTVAPVLDTIPGGAQTIPFKKVGDIETPVIEIIKTVTTNLNPGSCPGVDVQIVSFNQEVKYCYEVINPNQVTPLLNVMVTDDNGTPGDTSDDFEVELTSGLTNEDNDGQADDLAPGATAYGEAFVLFNDISRAGSSIVNTATVEADGVTDSDTAQVDLSLPSIDPDIEIVKYVSVDGGSTFFDANNSTTAPATVIGGGAIYKFVITNTGPVDLENVSVADGTLGLSPTSLVNLAVGEFLEITSSTPDFGVLNQPGLCTQPGDITNIAIVNAFSPLLQQNVVDSDPAVVRCVTEMLNILKEVSIDGGATWFDANDGNSAPVIPLSGGAEYRITVSNSGTADMENVEVSDSYLGIENHFVGLLPAGGPPVVLTSGEIALLSQPQPCQNPGDIINIATVEGESSATGNLLSDTDPATLRCVEEEIELIKEISVDGGATYFDANSSGQAPAAAIGEGAVYRIRLTNLGTTELVNLMVNDAALGIENYLVNSLGAGQVIVLTSGDIAELENSVLCENTSDFVNTATVDATSAGTGNTVSDMDPAVLRCIEEAIELTKEISVDGGVTFFDANDASGAPDLSIGSDALYRITLRNAGTGDLIDLVLNDNQLGITDWLVPGILSPGETVILTQGEIPQLNQTQLCEFSGTLTNIASVNAVSGETGNSVSDSDPALVNCIAEAAGVLVIDEDGIDNGLFYWPGDVTPGVNNGAQFTAGEVNDNLADEGLRAPLPFFVTHIGETFQLNTGQVGDEGWFALQSVPRSWSNGLRSFVDGTISQNKLDKIRDVTPLRATGLKLLEGGNYCAVVYDSDISINYGPLQGNLQGANLGIAAFHVTVGGVMKLDGFSSGTLPTVHITVLDPVATCGGALRFVDAPRPPSSSEPYDIDPDNPSGGYQ